MKETTEKTMVNVNREAGKGSQQRPTDRQKFEENFERIFGKPKEKEKK